MGKIEERHNNEFNKANTQGKLVSLEQKYYVLLKTGTPDDSEALEKLYQNIIETAQNVNIKASEALAKKIEANHQRRLRYHHVGSLNYKVGAKKSNEFIDFVTSKEPTPEQALIDKEKHDEYKSALNTLKPIDLIIFQTYEELGFYPNHANWKELSKILLTKDIKMTDKTVKKHFEKAFSLLQSLLK